LRTEPYENYQHIKSYKLLKVSRTVTRLVKMSPINNSTRYATIYASQYRKTLITSRCTLSVTCLLLLVRIINNFCYL